MNFYETVVILNPSLGEEEAKAVIDKITDLLKNAEGELFKVEVWGKRRLAYEMSKQKMGNYVFLLFKAPSAAIKKLEEYFKVLDVVLKFMVVKLRPRSKRATDVQQSYSHRQSYQGPRGQIYARRNSGRYGPHRCELEV